MLRRLVILAEFVGQAGIGIGADQRVGDAAELVDMRAHFLGAERAVEPDRQRRGVAHGIPESLRRLAGEKAAGEVGDGAGDHQRHVDAALFGDLGNGVDRRLGVERVEDGLDQQHVGAAVEQTPHLLAVGHAQIVEGDGAEAGIAHVGRDRGGAVGRAERAGDETRLAVFLFGDPGRVLGELRALDVQLIGQRLHAVVGLGDGGRREGVGLDDVGARQEIREVDVADRGRLREDQEIVVAFHVAVPVREARAAITGFVQPQRLDHGAHGAVEHQDALGRRAADGGC